MALENCHEKRKSDAQKPTPWVFCLCASNYFTWWSEQLYICVTTIILDLIKHLNVCSSGKLSGTLVTRNITYLYGYSKYMFPGLSFS